MTDFVPGWSLVADEVSPSRGIAPLSFWVPVPGLNKQVGVLAITDNAPSCRQDLPDLVGPKEGIRGIARHTIHSGTQSIERSEDVHHMGWSGVHSDCLPARQNRMRDTYEKKDCQNATSHVKTSFLHSVPARVPGAESSRAA